MRLLNLASLFLLSGLAAGAAAAETPVRVMTYNLRYDEPKDPITWDVRGPLLAGQIRRAAPTVLGTQEGLSYQVADLAKWLPEYAYVGVGRGPDNPTFPYGEKRGEFNALFYRKDALEVLRSGTFWLSTTPDIAGSKSDLSGLPRISTWAEFKDLKSSKTFFVFNTHLPHESGEKGRAARAFAAATLTAQIAQITATSKTGQPPIIVTGDFNAAADDKAEQEAVTLPFGRSFTDAFTATNQRSGPASTFYGFDSSNVGGVRIDYIWTSKVPALQVKSYRVLNDKSGNYYLSDHLPVVAELSLP